MHVEGETHRSDDQRAEGDEDAQAVSFRAAEAHAQSQQSCADEGEGAKSVKGLLPYAKRDAFAVKTEAGDLARA